MVVFANGEEDHAVDEMMVDTVVIAKYDVELAVAAVFDFDA